MKKSEAQSRPLALVTGASSGLGWEFARQLAARGYDLFLCARRLDRLNQLKARIEKEFGVKVTTCKADLSQSAGVDTILKALKPDSRAVEYLVNNAGYGIFDYFANRPFSDWEKMITTNCLSLIRLTRELLPAMSANRRGYILNVASIAGFMQIPLYTVYSATKNMVLSFTEALHMELKDSGVHVSALCPGPVLTEFFEVSGIPEDKNPSFLMTAPELNVRQGLAAVEKNRPVVVPGIFNKLLIFAIRFVSRLQVRRRVFQMYKKLK